MFLYFGLIDGSLTFFVNQLIVFVIVVRDQQPSILDDGYFLFEFMKECLTGVRRFMLFKTLNNFVNRGI